MNGVGVIEIAVKIVMMKMIKSKTSYRTKKQSNSFAKGENKSKEQSLADNPVDACYEKIVELHELNLL